MITKAPCGHNIKRSKEIGSAVIAKTTARTKPKYNDNKSDYPQKSKLLVSKRPSSKCSIRSHSSMM